MSIPITDKFKPRNNGTFPLVDAEDVLMPDGTRLSDLDTSAGKDGKDGVSATHSWNGTVLTVTSASGTSSADLKGEKGDKGDTGEPGAKGDKGDKGDPGDSASITVDSALSDTSTNPVQNKVIYAYFQQALEALGTLQDSIPTESDINALIDAKLGVIENGSY